MKREFPLPETLPNETFSTYLIGPDQLLLHWTTYDEFTGQFQHLAWLGADGKVSRSEDFQLANAGNGPANPYLMMAAGAGVAPIPVGWAAMMGIVAPLGFMNANEVPTYAAALTKVLEMVWPALIIVTVIGCFSAWVVWRWQRKYFRPATRAWCTFAFLLGLPGLVAYWLEMHRTKLEACGECQKTVPRDRDACAACATPSPPRRSSVRKSLRREYRRTSLREFFRDQKQQQPAVGVVGCCEVTF